jgi:quercetin dioxygenase-like cupin family protein
MLGFGVLATVTAVALASTDRRAQPIGVTITPLAQATVAAKVHASSSGIRIETNGPKEMLVTSIAVDPGGSFGWHSHPGPVLVSVAAGTLALFHAHGGHCVRETIQAGQGFIEDGRDIHLARNEGSVPVQIYATFLARPGTTAFLKDEPAPSVCHVAAN